MNQAFEKAAIREDIPGIILLSHGGLALGLLNTARVVLGNAYNIAAFTLEPEDDPHLFRQAFTEAVNSFPAGAVILVDMFGGSPCNQLLMAAGSFCPPYCAFGGMNLPLLVEAATMRELFSGEALRGAIAAAIPSAVVDLSASIKELEET